MKCNKWKMLSGMIFVTITVINASYKVRNKPRLFTQRKLDKKMVSNITLIPTERGGDNMTL